MPWYVVVWIHCPPGLKCSLLPYLTGIGCTTELPWQLHNLAWLEDGREENIAAECLRLPEKRRERSAICRFTLQMPDKAGAGWSRQPELRWGLPGGWQGPRHWASSVAFPSIPAVSWDWNPHSWAASLTPASQLYPLKYL